ncbi:MAG TPA: beta family protein [Candidatus Saccharimonadales bacterium]
MLDNINYVPILKWKRAEQGALKDLSDVQKKRIMPLIELVMPKPKVIDHKNPNELYEESISIFQDKRSKEIADEVLASWGKRPILIDFSLLYTPELKSTSVNTIIEQGIVLGLSLVPVINLSDEDSIKSAVASLNTKHLTGICLRISPTQLKNIDDLNTKLDEFLQDHKLQSSGITLLIDLKEECEETGYEYYFKQSQKIAALNNWGGFIISCGAFPEDLSGCKKDEENILPRLDWNNWHSLDGKQGIVRVPTYSDYTMRHPIYNEALQFYHPTASIKYTLNDGWLVMKGEKQKFGQYLASAKVLKDDTRFFGEDFSTGDKYIEEKGQHFDDYIKDPEKIKGTGNTETWIRASINHHLSVVVGQLAN